MAGPSPFLLWDQTLTLRTGGGYNSNPSLAYLTQYREPSGFVEFGGDLMFFRLPIDGDTVYILLSGDDRRYFDSKEAPGEQNFLAQLSYLHESDSWWNAGGAFTYLYVHQVFDLSSLDAGVGTADIQGNSLTFRPAFGAKIGTNWLAKLELPVNRQFYSEPADGFTETGPQLTFTRKLAANSQASLGYSWTHRAFDSSPLFTDGGVVINGSLARLNYNTATLRWLQNWDAQKHWSTTVRLGFTAARDNGVGFYDYNRLRAGGTVKFRAGRWTIAAEGGGAWYDYLEQATAPGAASLRERQDYATSLRVELAVWRELKWLVAYTLEKSVSNLPEDRYTARTVSTGLEREF